MMSAASIWTWEFFKHCAGREAFHWFAAVGIAHISIWFMITYHTKPQVYRYMPHTLIPMMMISGLITVMVAFLREPWDVAVVGDPWQKSIIDWFFWVFGTVCGEWDAYRKLLYCDGKDRKWVAALVGKLRPSFGPGSEDQISNQ